MSIEIKKLAKSIVEIIGEIPEKDLEKHRPRAIKNISEAVDIPGFRKGMAPENILMEKVGEMSILEEIAHLALNDAYPKIVLEENLDVIGQPEITITKIGKGSPLGFKIKSAIVPELDLPNYKKIAKEEMAKTEKTFISTEEVDQALEEIRKARATKEKVGEEEKEILPELNDEFAKTLGKFEGLEDLKTKLKENMLVEKEMKGKEKTRLNIIDRIVAEIKNEIPDIIIDSEVEKLLQRLKSDIERAGLKLADYLKGLNKTEEDFKKDWRPEGEKRAKIELALAKIAAIEYIKPEEEELEKEIGHVMEHYKGAQEENVRAYVATILTNEKVFQFLEGQK